MSDRFDDLSPRDIAITLRSLRRRFGTVAAGARAGDLPTLVDAPGPAGESLATLFTTAAQGAGLWRHHVEQALDHEQPVVPAAVLDRTEMAVVEARVWPVDVAAESIADDADHIADRLDDAGTSEQIRTVSVAGGGSTSALEIARIASRELIADLGACQRQLDWMRQSS